MDLAGRIAVGTGASRAIGAATAHRVAEAGATVIVGNNRKPETAASVVAPCPASRTA